MNFGVKSCKASLHLFCFTCFLISLSAARPAAGAEIRLDGVVDLQGRAAQWQLSRDQKSTVFVFLSVDCPISNRYAPTLRKLQTEFQDARWILVYPNVDESAAAIQKNLKEYDLSCEAWRDTQHALVKSAQVSVTPEAAVYVPRAGFVYRGRIDDRYVDFGKTRAEASTNDLREILVEIQNGKVPAPRAAKATGCSIPKLKD
jgi:hypothetical protein